MQYVAHVKTGVVWQPQQQPNYFTTLNGTAPPSPTAGFGVQSTVAVVNTTRVWQPQQKPYLTTITRFGSDIRIGLDTEGWPAQVFSNWDFAQKPSLLVIQPTPVVYNPATDVTRLKPMSVVFSDYQTFAKTLDAFTIVNNPPPVIPYVPATDVTRLKPMSVVWSDYQSFPQAQVGYVPVILGIRTADFVLLQDAIASAVNEGFIVGQPVATEYSNTVPYGYVISQQVVINGGLNSTNQPPGSVVPLWSTIYFTMSLGKPQIQLTTVVPNVVGMPVDQAKSTLFAAALIISGPSTGGSGYIYVNSNTVPSGFVVAQSITAGITVVQGTSIILTMSIGPAVVPPTVVVPNLTKPPVPFIADH